MNGILSLFDCPLRDFKRLLLIMSRQGFNIVQVSPLQRIKEKKRYLNDIFFYYTSMYFTIIHLVLYMLLYFVFLKIIMFVIIKIARY